MNVFMVVHVDPEMDRETDAFQVSPEVYRSARLDGREG